MGSRCLADPLHDVRRTGLFPPARAFARYAAAAGLHYLRSCSHAQLADLSGLHLLLMGDQAVLFLAAIYVLLFWISIFNMALAFALFNRSVGLFGLGATLIFPLYQGVYLKCARFFSYSSEILFATSRYDDFVPPRVRRALFGNRIAGAAPKWMSRSTASTQTFPIPSKAAGARPDGSFALPMRRSCSGWSLSLSSISARRSSFSQVPASSPPPGTWSRFPSPCKSIR